MKRIISFILTFCMLMSLTAAFAENDNEIENNENIIDTSSLTDENVLYTPVICFCEPRISSIISWSVRIFIS